MRCSFWTGIGVLLTVAMVVLSAFINYSFGYSLGTTETNARIFGAVSVVTVGVMAMLPLRVSAHWSSDRKLCAGLGVAVLRVPSASVCRTAAIWRARGTLNAQLKDDVAERDQAMTRLKALDEHQPRPLWPPKSRELRRIGAGISLKAVRMSRQRLRASFAKGLIACQRTLPRPPLLHRLSGRLSV